MAISIMGAIERFAAMAIEAEVARREALEKAAKVVEEEAKAEIGHYQDGWAQLQESTQADRVKQGYPADEPLLREGDLRESITHAVDGHKAVVGSNDMVAVYQFMGTDHIPPRDALGGALRRKEREVVEILGKDVILRAVDKAKE